MGPTSGDLRCHDPCDHLPSATLLKNAHCSLLDSPFSYSLVLGVFAFFPFCLHAASMKHQHWLAISFTGPCRWESPSSSFLLFVYAIWIHTAMRLDGLERCRARIRIHSPLSF